VQWKLDRLSRSVVDGVTTLAKWCERRIRVVSVTQQLDFNGAIGKMLAAVFPLRNARNLLIGSAHSGCC